MLVEMEFWAEVLKFQEIYQAGYDIVDVIGDGNCGIWAMYAALKHAKLVRNTEFYKGEGILHYENMLNMQKK